MADLDAEFARFAAELATVEQEVAVEEPAAAAPAAAPAHPPPSVAAPPTSGPSSIARPAATLAAPPQPAGAPTGAAPQSHFPLPSAPPPVAAPAAAAAAPFQMPPPSAPPPFAAPAAPPSMQQPPAPYGGAAQQQYYGGHGADMYGHGHMQHVPAMHAPPSVLAPPVPSADMLQRLKADLMKQEKQANPKIKNLASSKALAAKAASSSGKGVVRQAAGKRWFDPTLGEWPENDFRVFVGDIGNEVNDDHLAKAFQKYSSFAKAKVVRCARTSKTKGYGFVSFLESADMVKALKEMNGKYIGNRPCKLSRSNWDERSAPTKRKGGEQQGGPQKRAG